MIYVSFIPWVLYTLLNIKYSKKEYKIINYKLPMIMLIYLYSTTLRNTEIIYPIFFVSGVFLLIDTYYLIPKSKERIRNNYSKYMYVLPFIPILTYILFGHKYIIFISMFIISLLIDLFLYLYHKTK